MEKGYNSDTVLQIAKELAASGIPLILTSVRSAPWVWENRDMLPGPPLTPSPAQLLTEAGVKYSIAIMGDGDYRLRDLALEASWAAKFAGLDEKDAVALVSKNVEEALGLPSTKDIVIWEGSPLQF